jgi:hypothetical protein
VLRRMWDVFIAGIGRGMSELTTWRRGAECGTRERGETCGLCHQNSAPPPFLRTLARGYKAKRAGSPQLRFCRRQHVHVIKLTSHAVYFIPNLEISGRSITAIGVSLIRRHPLLRSSLVFTHPITSFVYPSPRHSFFLNSSPFASFLSPHSFVLF